MADGPVAAVAGPGAAAPAAWAAMSSAPVSLLPRRHAAISASPAPGFYYLNGSGRKGIDGDYLAAPHCAASPAKLSHMDLARRWRTSETARALFCWNINIAASNPDQARLQQALAREDLLTVVLDLFQTDTADFADFVLPAASFLEFDDIVSPYFNLTLSAQVQAMAAHGRGAAQSGDLPPARGAPWASTSPSCSRATRRCWPTRRAGRYRRRLCGAEAKAGTVELWQEPVLQFADLKFPTPSGKIEIASAQAEAVGLPRTPLPLIDARPAKGHLRLLSPASPWLMNSSYGNEPHIAAKMGADIVVLHPADARSAISAKAHGAGRQRARRAAHARQVDDMVPRGMALAWKSRWPKRQPGHANVNVLNPGRKADMAGSTAVHSVEVTVTPA